ncbi:hypothetical protein SAMN05444266_104120 [Chitinophaga jiangningensis]|uniref:Uncharacterized protein n=1 Tax=Chitinophaga jiangningensis TaxID=1419482 RepID=A0A1M7BXX6_9BACT|nr:hypothetical protein [Chitinophaga jiangningensis]SHL59787.1 hypothetical protein SAMN05444266_104120 [Chitinophaga jiangningensis]
MLVITAGGGGWYPPPPADFMGAEGTHKIGTKTNNNFPAPVLMKKNSFR